MADTTPEPGDGAAQKPAARKKAPARKPAAKRSPASQSAAPASSPSQSEAAKAPEGTTSPEPATASAATPATAPTATAAHAEPASHDGSRRDHSILDSVRANPMGPLTAGLIVAIAVGLLLSVLVPNDPSVLAMVILGTLLAAAVGFAVRYLSAAPERGLRRQLEALIATAVGVHLMSVTGTVGGEIPLLSDLGAAGPGFNEALLVAFATPAVSTGALLAGLTAAIIVGWARSRHR
ncbi:hypothetical protein [Demequina muriae]|uniref:Uncharacterized protein n=1 Tax=Demequina muriae TaxID=3051664 RepID=A0ABT8GHP3_9MICO|nr:hypothetical protein [Demequina sp. EGI L300058]MDN4480956.1 hypothetical protein [Demequina sp. EGI L300058]